jgi:hypothetical protein
VAKRERTESAAGSPEEIASREWRVRCHGDVNGRT